MYTDIHTDFILTPILSILEQGVNASQSLPSGIESFPISEYYLQSLFLRMTGASEQKIKCIFWQMATDDFEYRYKYMNYQGLGECSTYSSKNTAFKDLISQICKKQPTFSIQTIWSDYVYSSELIAEKRTKWELKVKTINQKQIDHIVNKNKSNGHPMSQESIDKMTASIIGKAIDEVDFSNHLSASKRKSTISSILDNLCSLFSNTNIATWRAIDFNNFCEQCHTRIKGCEIAKDENDLLCGSMVGLYDFLVYIHRNRTAHNTIVYQQNLPALDTLAKKDYCVHNYFYRFAIIIIMDEVFLRLYRAYLNTYKPII